MTCPDPQLLRDLVDLAISEAGAASVAGHLESCAECRARLDTLTDTSGLALANPRETPAALQDVMRRLQSRSDHGLTFLQPAERPGAIGRFGPYDVIDVLGRGGMGIVLKAHDPTLHREVAIKLLLPELATQPEARERFLREARAAAGVVHDHIVTIHAVDEIDGLPCLVMAHVVGESLEERVTRGARMGVAEIVRVGTETAHGLGGAHGKNLVHRDIKPANILLEGDTGRVKIADFGLAKAIDDVGLTQPGMIAGSPQYMAPEQALAQKVDHRADLFALGCVLYFMCTGRPPFDGDSIPTVMRQVCDEEPLAVRKINPDTPDWLVAVIQRLMAKDPDRRYANAAEVVAALDRSPAPTVRTETAPSAPRVSWVPWAVAAAIVAAAIVIGAVSLRGDDPPDDAVAVDDYGSLADAVRAEAVVELRGDGPYGGDEIRIDRPVTIRAAPGARPVITARLVTTAALVLEGVDLRWSRDHTGDPTAEDCAVRVQGGSLEATGCRFDVGARNACVSVSNGSATLRDCRLSGGAGAFLEAGRLTARNTVVETNAGFMVAMSGSAVNSIELERTTLVTKMGLQLRVGGTRPTARLEVDAKRSVVQAGVVCVMRRNRGRSRRTPTVAEARAAVKTIVRWRDDRTVYSVSSSFAVMVMGVARPQPVITSHAEWQELWGPGSHRGRITFDDAQRVRSIQPPPPGIDPSTVGADIPLK